MTDRVEFIESFSAGGTEHVLNFDRSSIFNALVMCLSPADACAMLDPTFEQPYFERRAVLRKIRCDIGADTQVCHRHLLQTLVSALQMLPPKRRPSAAGTLLQVAAAMGSPEDLRALEAVCLAPQAMVRRRAYTYVRHTPDSASLPESVVTAFDTFSDVEAAMLLVRRAAADLLLERFDRLVDTLGREKFGLSRLFMRVGNREPGLLEELKVISPVSHAYVCAKLGIPLSSAEMVDLYRTTMFSDESGLVAWCCGQMGLWDALKEIAVLSDNPPDSAYRQFRDPSASP
jgi:hypothetical protein